MFGTLRYNSDTKVVEHVELKRADGFEARGYSRTACNECRIRKLKCSSEENGCQRCRAISTTCIYQSNADKSTDRRRRQSTQSFTHPTSISSRDNSLEIEQTTRLQSRRQPGDQTQSTETPDTEMPGDLSWALSPLPEVPDLYWDFPGGDSQHMMDVGQTLSIGDNVPRTPAFSSCASLAHKSPPQSLDLDIQVDNDIVDVSYNLDSSHPSSQYLHQPDQSLVSSASMAVSRKHNSSHSSLTMHKQGDKSSPRAVLSAQLHRTVGSQRGSQPRDSVINLDSIMDPPGKRARPASGLTQLHASRLHNSPSIAFVAPNITSVSSTSGSPSFSKSTSARSSEPPGSSDTGSTCQCVAMMLKILENMGVQGFGTNAQDTGAGLDVILSSLARGMNMTEQVLTCGKCNACTENGMLLATIAQQLGATSGSVLDSSNNNDPTRSTSDLLEGTIFFGRYKVDNPEIRLQLVYHALLLHIRQLQEILAHIKDRVDSNRGAWKLLANTELEVGKLWDIFHSKVSHQK